MKKHFLRLIACALALATFLPAAATFAAADAVLVESMEVTGLFLPEPGLLAADIYETADPGEPARFEIDESGTYWTDEAGRRINNPEYAFEAGFAYGMRLALRAKTGYKLSTSALPALAGLDAGDYTVNFGSGNGTLNVYNVKFKAAGSAEYAPIKTIRLCGFAEPADGAKPDASGVEASYCRAFVYSAEWSGTFGGGRTYLSGNTYTLTVVLEAYAGFSFAQQSGIDVDIDGVKPDEYRYYKNGNANRLELKFFYRVPDKDRIETVRVSGLTLPFAGEAAKTVLMNTLSLPGGADYVLQYSTVKWKDESRKFDSLLREGDHFKYGRSYSLELYFTAKSENVRFAENAALYITDAAGAEYLCERIYFSSGRVGFRISAKAKFRAGAGSSESSPAVCRSFDDLKGALEESGIRFALLKDVEFKENSTTFVLPDKTAAAAINVIGKKTLILDGEAAFQCEYTTAPKYLIHAASGADFVIKGSGKLEYYAPNCADAAVIGNSGRTTVEGNVLIEGHARNHRNVYDACAINQRNVKGAVLVINSGRFHTVNAADTKTPHAALIIDGGETQINSGAFTHSDNVVFKRSSPCYGIYVRRAQAEVVINGGSFEGILLPPGKQLSAYVAAGGYVALDGSVVSANGREIFESGVTEAGRFIESVELHVNVPRAGAAQAKEAYFTSGNAAVKAIKWYDVTAGKYMSAGEAYTAGHYYNAEITIVPESGYKFKATLRGDIATAVKLNHTNANRYKADGMSVYDGMKLVYASFLCPYTVNDMEFEIPIPVSGAAAGFKASAASAAYYALESDIDWYDYTAGGFLAAGSKFEEGHVYGLQIWANAAKGYSFEQTVTARVNGAAATVGTAYERDPEKTLMVSAVYECKSGRIESASAECAVPQAGGYPGENAVPGGAGYKTELAGYYTNGRIMNENEKFDWGGEYTVRIKFIPLGGYAFASGAKFFISGEQADKVEYAGTTVTAERKFRLPEAGSEVGAGEDGGFVPGDVNGNGVIDAADYAMAKRAFLGNYDLSAEQFERADIDGDGELEAVEYAMIKRHCLGNFVIPGAEGR